MSVQGQNLAGFDEGWECPLFPVVSTGRRNTLPLRGRWSVMRLRRKRRFFTAAESAEIWDRWRKGEGLKSIGRVFGKTSSSIFAHISPSGGIRPPPRRRSRLALTLAEREEISRGLVHGHSLRRIACSLGRAPSTVSREIARNGGSGPYRAAASDRRAWDRARRPKACKLAMHDTTAASCGGKAQNAIGRPSRSRVAEADASRG